MSVRRLTVSLANNCIEACGQCRGANTGGILNVGVLNSGNGNQGLLNGGDFNAGLVNFGNGSTGLLKIPLF